MKSILLCLYLFTLGSRGANIPTELDSNGAEDASAKLNDKSIISKRAVGTHNTDSLYKLNLSPVCFSARGNQFATVTMPFTGKLAAMKLIHRYGYVTCHRHNPVGWSHWGCGHLKDYVNVVITTSRNIIILPPDQFLKFNHQAGKWSKVPGYGADSHELILSFFTSPRSVRRGQQLRVWYGEDLMGWTEGDNGGRVCFDVYGSFV
ncbi:uncharacterized protein LOC111341409 [Stylophora pistillata]|uniref:SET domain-containing protein n=1 Tax=Stylophora pistillata TaxID=50429 RepID=A0A2B4RJQ5_STYPI|nr:uncharacterized protein LOC111341409 [Stylophora pistillata]PFX17043.1 hypothetical protein AWC38_SpisGene18660 [Stylophora pistillata]